MGLHACLGILPAGPRLRWIAATAVAIGFTLIFAAGRLALLNGQIGGGLTDALNTNTLPFAWSALRNASLALAIGAGALMAGMFIHAKWLIALGAVAIAGSFAFTGHTQSLEEPGIAPLAIAIHVLIAGYWVVAPLTLHPALNPDDERLAGQLERFSRVAIFAVPVLIVVGAWLAWTLAGGFRPLLSTAYGWLLMAKLGAALLAMSAGALNKQFVTGLIQRAPARGRFWLSVTLAVEMSMFLAAIVLVSIATTVFPPTGI